MLDDVNCPKCNSIITNDDAVKQGVAIEDAIAYADVFMICPHCGSKLKLKMDISWKLYEVK